MMGDMPRLLPVILSILFITLATGCRKREAPGADAGATRSRTVKIVQPAAPGSFVKLVASVAPSVVQLSTTVPVRGGPADWFPEGGELASADEEAAERRHRSLGSGIIIGSDGFILTCAHIVARAEQIRVHVSPKLVLLASLVGKDDRGDVALLRVAPPARMKLRAARLGDSDDLQLGEWVAALGKPFGDVMMSAGVISARPRKELSSGDHGTRGMVMTDADIHAGNAGGPLINMQGQVVGINSPRNGNAAGGPGFAVPINLAREVVKLLRRQGKVTRSWVGLYMDRVTVERATKAKLGRARGAFVTRVVAGGPAARAGIKAGDIILTFDGKALLDSATFPRLAALMAPNRQVPVVVWREGKEVGLSLQSEVRPQD